MSDEFSGNPSVESWDGEIDIDVQTERRGNTAVKRDTGDPNTEVFSGGLHVRVVMRDVGLHVTMNPSDENWNDPTVARRVALKAVADALTTAPKLLLRIVSIARSSSFDDGQDAARLEMRKALGLED